MYNNDEPKWNVKELYELHEKIDDCGGFISLFSENYKKDPTCLIQLGFAMMLDKPILLLVPNGVAIPRAFERVATAIEFYDTGDTNSMKVATEKLLAAGNIK